MSDREWTENGWSFTRMEERIDEALIASAAKSCPVYWGSHGCSLIEGHPGDTHVCATQECEDETDPDSPTHWEICCETKRDSPSLFTVDRGRRP